MLASHWSTSFESYCTVLLSTTLPAIDTALHCLTEYYQSVALEQTLLLTPLLGMTHSAYDVAQTWQCYLLENLSAAQIYHKQITTPTSSQKIYILTFWWITEDANHIKWIVKQNFCYLIQSCQPWIIMNVYQSVLSKPVTVKYYHHRCLRLKIMELLKYLLWFVWEEGALAYVLLQDYRSSCTCHSDIIYESAR